MIIHICHESRVCISDMCLIANRVYCIYWGLSYLASYSAAWETLVSMYGSYDYTLMTWVLEWVETPQHPFWILFFDLYSSGKARNRIWE